VISALNGGNASIGNFDGMFNSGMAHSAGLITNDAAYDSVATSDRSPGPPVQSDWDFQAGGLGKNAGVRAM
jgi:hypothetical protein